MAASLEIWIYLALCLLSVRNTQCQQQKKLVSVSRDNFMLFVDGPQGKMFQMALNGTSVVELSAAARKPQNPVAVDYDPLSRWIYWTDIETHTIRRSRLGESSIAATTDAGLSDPNLDQVFLQLTPASSPEGVVVDPVAKLLFYTDNGRNTINVVRTENSRDHRILITYAKHPRTIQIDPTRRHIYWTDWGLGTIERASYNGLNRTIIVHGEDKWINGLALDLINRQMYWTDAQRGIIERANMDGTERVILIDERRAVGGGGSSSSSSSNGTDATNETASATVRPHYYGIALDETYIYYTDWSRGIFRALKNGTSRQKLTPADSTAFTVLNGIKVYKSKIFQQTLGSPSGCRQRNGGCTNLCVPLSESTFTCMCPDLSRLSDDNATCNSGIQADGPDVVWVEHDGATTSYIRGIRGDPRDFLRTRDVLTWSVRSRGWHWTALDMNLAARKLYLADKTDRFVVQLSVNGSLDLKIVLSGTSSAVNGIAVDWASGNIYWTDGLYRWIAVTSPSTASLGRKTVVSSDLDRPYGIAVWPQKGLLFWSDWGAGDANIKYSTLMGEQVKTLVDSDLIEPRSLAIDYTNSRVYWCTQHTIQSISSDGTGRTTHAVSAINNFIGISLHMDYVIATEQAADGRGPQLWIFDRKQDVNTGYKLALVRHPSAVIMYDLRRQPPIESPCQRLNCQHLCVTTGVSAAQCACYDGFNLASDRSRCTEDRTLLHGPAYIYSIGDQICTIPADDAQQTSVTSASVPSSLTTSGSSANFDPNESCFFGGTIPSTVSAADLGAGSRSASGGDSTKYEFRALDFNYRRGELFFSESGFRVKTIRKAHLIERQNNSAVIHGVGLVKGLAVDWINDNLYWTDYTYNQVWMSRIDGQYQKILATNLSGPGGIVIDHTKKKLYWTEDGTKGFGKARIAQANLDGSDITPLYGDVVKPTGLAIDYNPRGDRLFWTDMARNTIESINLQSTEHRVETIPTYQGKLVVDVAVYQDFIIYTSLEPNNASALHVFEQSNRREANRDGLRHIGHPKEYDVIAYAESKQPLYNRVDCGEFAENGGCEQLMTPTSDGRCQCTCSDGFALNKDGKTCSSVRIPDDNFFILADDYRNQIFIADVNFRQVSAVKITPLDRPIGVEYDYVDDRIYWTDFETSVVKRVFRNGSNLETIRNLGPASRVDGLAIATQSRLLYYTDSDRNEIGIMSLDGGFRKVLLKQNVSSPRAIVIDPRNGYMYFPVRNAGRGRIDRCYMDGTNCVTIVKSNSSWPNGLTIDLQKQRIYWCDAHTERIEAASLDGSGRRVVYIGLAEADPFGIALQGNFIYWTDWGLRGLFRVRRGNSSAGPPSTEAPFGGNQTKAERLSPGFFRGLNDIKFFNKTAALQQTSEACSINNGGCSHFCLPIPGGTRVCACPDTALGESVYPPDGKDCTGTLCTDEMANGRFHPQCSRTVGSLCPFTCNPGYGPVSSDPVFCQHSLRWDRDPNSLCRDNSCPLLVNSDHVITETGCPPLAGPGVTCTQRCAEGYAPSGGSTSRTCTTDLQWTGTDLTCTAAVVPDVVPITRKAETTIVYRCPPVAPPPEVIVEPTDCLTSYQSVGSECILRCASGMSLASGDQRRVCTGDQRWTGEMIRCINDTSNSDRTADQSEPTATNIGQEGGSKAGLIVGLTFGLLFITAIAMAAFILYRRYVQQQKPPMTSIGNSPPSPPARMNFRGPDSAEYQPQRGDVLPSGVATGYDVPPVGSGPTAAGPDYSTLTDFDNLKLRIATGIHSFVRFTGVGGHDKHASADGSSSGYQSTEGSIYAGNGSNSGLDAVMSFDNPLFRALSSRASDRRKLVEDSTNESSVA